MTIIQLTILSFIIFLFHRIINIEILGGHYEMSSQFFKNIVVGIFSDLWVCVALGAIYSSVVSLIVWIYKASCKRSASVNSLIYLSIVFLVGLLSPYYEFFHSQFQLIHFNYLTDTDFISSNSATAISVKSISVFGLSFLLYAYRKYFNFSIKFKGWLGLFFISFFAHAFNVHYKVQWFVPRNLQMNEVEYIVEQLLKPRVNVAFSSSELENKFSGQSNFELIRKNYALYSEGNEIVKELQKIHKPIIIIFLFESLRSKDTGIGQPSNSLTPFIDELSKKSVVFENAYSVSSVTRSGQEASFCGYLSSKEHSLMRERNDIDFPCIPRLIEGAAHTFWHHGGVGAFDGQREFWLKQGVEDLISQRDFSDGVPKTGWGVSDKVLVEKSLKQIAAQKNKAQIGMLLSVTNHIPWDLPSDSKVVLDKSEPGYHPSFSTIEYSDEALKNMVLALQEMGLWERTILFVAGDHGVLTPLRPGSAIDKVTDEEKISHIPLMISGGVIEKIDQSRLNISRYVSQASIATTILEILKINDAGIMAPSLFSDSNHDVLVNLGDRYYLPETKEIIYMNDESVHEKLSNGSQLYNKIRLLEGFYRKPDF